MAASGAGRLPPDWRLLATLVPPRGYFPDFLTPSVPDRDVRAAVERVAGTPRRELRRDLEPLDARRARAPFAQALWRGAPGAAERLGTALTAYHAAAIAPSWERIEAQTAGDRSRRASALLADGVEGLLRTLPPALRWRPPALEVDYPVDQDLVLGGRGLLLVPSFFCLETGITLLNEHHAPTLVYPVEHRPPDDLAVPEGEEECHRVSLAALLGHTRAAVLQALEVNGTTGELAHRVGVLPSSASQHLGVLRRAGLVRTVRRGRTAFHTRTPMGAALAERGWVREPELGPSRRAR
ncbi:ArsR/SmtB family transcription factor [Streptomyces triticirhizae]|uniref:ArsR/SmtB family transcription factor n=1 Tax=Streptomyces triticirhizae TaxID=2483353 RepID=UPI0018F6EC86|nr:winged helix-turn-helix domain-containing protein [Streptomyces triticirhizae]